MFLNDFWVYNQHEKVSKRWGNFHVYNILFKVLQMFSFMVGLLVTDNNSKLQVMQWTSSGDVSRKSPSFVFSSVFPSKPFSSGAAGLMDTSWSLSTCIRKLFKCMVCAQTRLSGRSCPLTWEALAPLGSPPALPPPSWSISQTQSWRDGLDSHETLRKHYISLLIHAHSCNHEKRKRTTHAHLWLSFYGL